MNFSLSSGTLDALGQVFEPSQKHGHIRNGTVKAPRSGETLFRLSVAAFRLSASSSTIACRLSPQTKCAFGGSSRAVASRRAVALIDRTTRGVPEVMVRITGRQHGSANVLAKFAYISRLGRGTEGELGLQTSDEDVIFDRREMRELAREWQEWEVSDDNRRNGATSLSIVLSMPRGTEPEKVKAAALDFARDEFANRSWVASLHVDRDHPHVHLTIARRDYDGRRFHADRADLFRHRERFAEKLRSRGVEANATPAKARGIDPVHEHIAARKIRERGGVPNLDLSRDARAERYRVNGDDDPAKMHLKARRAMLQAAYERLVADLIASPSMVHQVIAKGVQRFADSLPEPEPNSIRAARVARTEWRDRSAGSDGPDTTLARSDALAAALYRLSFAQQREVGGRRVYDLPKVSAVVAEQAPPSAWADWLRALVAEPESRSARQTQDEIAKLLREVQERDRGQRERAPNLLPEKGPRR